jgi:putative FmdB family regulatory protein
MPIYEFRCLFCGHVFELLEITQNKEKIEVKCPNCASKTIERLLSKIGIARSKSGSAISSFRSCGSGSCSTIDVPGPKK